MSGINFSYQYLEQILAQQAAAHPGLGGASGAGGPLNFPYFDPSKGSGDNAIDTQWSTGTSFDISIPYNKDGTIDIQKLLQKLHDILYYSHQGDTMDYNSIMDATAYFMNICSVWGQIQKQGAASEVTKYLTLPVTNPLNPNSKESIIDIINQIGIPSVIYGTWYSTKNAGATVAFANNFLAELNKISAGCSLLSPLAAHADSLINGNGGTDSGINLYINSNPQNDPNVNYFNLFAFRQALLWQTAFSCNSGAQDYFDAWRHTELEGLLAGAKGNPFLAYILIMYVLMNENGDMQTTIAGQGNLTNYLSNPMGNNSKEISSAWSAGNFTDTSAQTFYKEIMALSMLVQNQSVSSISPQIRQLLEALTNPKGATQISVTFTFTDTNGKTVTGTTTLAAIFQGIMTGQPVTATVPADNNAKPPVPAHDVQFNASWSVMAKAMNALQPNANATTSGTNPTPSFNSQPGYTTLTNLIQQITNSITSKSSAIGQIMQNDEGVNEKDLSMIQAAAEEVITPEKQINQNMSQANA